MERPESYDKAPWAEDPWECLAIAIIRQAAMDDRALRKCYRQASAEKRPLVESMLREIEDFFCGDWFKCLSDADGEIILRRIRRGM